MMNCYLSIFCFIGKKACLHVHGVYPYFCVAHKTYDETDDDFSYLKSLACALNEKLTPGASSGNKKYKTDSSCQVHKVEILKAL